MQSVTNHEQEIKSVRISSSLLEDLKKEAQSKDVSVNALIVSLLRNHNEYGKIDSDLSKKLVVMLIDSLDDEKLIAIAREYASVVPKEVMMTSFGEVSLNSLISYIRFIGHSGFFTFDVTRDESKKIMFICITHRAGPKMSLFAESLIVTSVHECFPSIRVESERSVNLVRFKLFLE